MFRQAPSRRSCTHKSIGPYYKYNVFPNIIVLFFFARVLLLAAGLVVTVLTELRGAETMSGLTSAIS